MDGSISRRMFRAASALTAACAVSGMRRCVRRGAPAVHSLTGRRAIDGCRA